MVPERSGIPVPLKSALAACSLWQVFGFVFFFSSPPRFNFKESSKLKEPAKAHAILINVERRLRGYDRKQELKVSWPIGSPG